MKRSAKGVPLTGNTSRSRDISPEERPNAIPGVLLTQVRPGFVGEYRCPIHVESREGLLNRWIILGGCAAGCLGLLLTGISGGRTAATAEDVRTPVLVELFTSQGCLSCPPADELLLRLDAEQPVPGALVIALSEHVEYWNGQWHDPFSSAVFTDRQREYQRAMATPALYTPQMVVDGQVQLIGSQQELAHTTIANASTQPKATLSLTRVDQDGGGSVSVSVDVSGMAGLGRVDAVLWVALTEDGLETDVKRGENAFRRLRHGAVVRTLQQVETLALPLPDDVSAETVIEIEPEWNAERLRAVVFLQERSSRRVLGATQRRLVQ